MLKLKGYGIGLTWKMEKEEEERSRSSNYFRRRRLQIKGRWQTISISECNKLKTESKRRKNNFLLHRKLILDMVFQIVENHWRFLGITLYIFAIVLNIVLKSSHLQSICSHVVKEPFSWFYLCCFLILFCLVTLLMLKGILP